MRLAIRTASTAALLGAISSLSCASMPGQAPPVVTPAGVRFVLAQPAAHGVAVAGSFNQWSVSSHPLAREGPDGAWMLIVALPPGEHAFMFVVDGVWISPPAAEDYADDGFGARNGVVVVEP